MAFATASSAANRKPDDNTQTAAPPQAQARPRQSPGKAEPPLRAPEPPARARARQRAPGPQRMPGPRRVLGRKPSSGALTEPSIGLPNVDRAKRQALVALAKPSPQRAPDSPERARTPSAPAPGARQDETGLQSVNQAEQRVPGALAKPAPSARQPPPDACQDENRDAERYPSRAASSRGEESPFLSSRGQKKRFFADSGPKHAILRAIGRPIRGQTTKTSISHFRDREKPSVLTASDQN